MMSSREDRAWRDFSRRFRHEVLPRILDSAVFLSIHSDNPDFDVQQATQLGAALLLDKPLLLVVPRGRFLGGHLRRAADIVVDDWDVDDPKAQERMADALKRLQEMSS
jgi:hypothetical protein